ncbi:hypothetical protein LOY42_15585 [Pseudomonas sp. B21-023]|nr:MULTISPECIES: hypothetical protein [unclassified Pseudomonas]UVL17364.1 hypothetical protein LOY44_15175 [Pseudomonas sp. B21-044]UVM14717.1 hypothetical protein LOY42_15585 [Pseudomonas sp. B21-023]
MLGYPNLIRIHDAVLVGVSAGYDLDQFDYLLTDAELPQHWRAVRSTDT